MNCKKHPSEPAVAQCASCGCYVCAECAERTSEVREKCGTLCIDCYKQGLYESIAYHESRRDEAKKYMVISMVLFGIGLLALIIGGIVNACVGAGWFELDNDGTFTVIAAMVIGYILLGAFPAFQEWRQANADQDEYEATHGATYEVTSSGDIVKDRNLPVLIARVAVKIMFGPIWSIVLWNGFRQIQQESQEYIDIFEEEIKSLR